MELTRSGSFRLFRLAGIDVFLHWSWFLVAFLQIQMRAGVYRESRIWMVAEYLTLFGIVLLHEFGHALACRSVGGIAKQIVLWPLGGVAYVSPPARPGAVLWSIAAGPLVNFLLIPVTFALLIWQGGPIDLKDKGTDLDRYLLMITLINIGLLVFNLIPVFPLDGGQILWALLWFVLGRWQSLQVVSFLGMFFGGLAVLGALWAHELWLSILAAFVVFRSASGFFQAREMLHIQALPRNPEAVCPSCGVNPPQGLYWVCDHCQSRFDTFANKGSCPNCGARFRETACPDCHKANPIGAWFGEPVEPQEVSATSEDDMGDF